MVRDAMYTSARLRSHGLEGGQRLAELVAGSHVVGGQPQGAGHQAAPYAPVIASANWLTRCARAPLKTCSEDTAKSANVTTNSSDPFDVGVFVRLTPLWAGVTPGRRRCPRLRPSNSLARHSDADLGAGQPVVDDCRRAS
jgi:hypothetical protein